MRPFACPVCGQLLSFENSTCLHCGAKVGIDPVLTRDIVLVGGEDGPRRCANLKVASCNWAVPAAEPGTLCLSCRLTRTRPADDHPDLRAFAETEAAKRRLVFQLTGMGLPVGRLDVEPETGMAFDLLSSRDERVITGHADGVVTLDLAEADDTHRVRMREQLAEPYRTLLGHLRHEVGHRYWTVLVTEEKQEGFRELFGDERQDYGAALERHYGDGPPEGWSETHVSAYATAHPWEDWAETFAHVLHIADTLETVRRFGLRLVGPEVEGLRDEAILEAVVPNDVSALDIHEVVARWLPVRYALNAVNRSMGRDDLYPFVLSPPVIAKLGFVHDLIRADRP